MKLENAVLLAQVATYSLNVTAVFIIIIILLLLPPPV